MESYWCGTAASPLSGLLSTDTTVITTFNHREAGSAQPPPIPQDPNEPWSTLSITKGTAPVPLLCQVVVSLHSVSPLFSRLDDIDGNLIATAQQYLICRLARDEPSPQLDEGWAEFYRQCQPIVIQTIRWRGLRGDDLEDCSQEVWKRISQALIDFVYDPARGRFCDWLTVVVRREASRARRRAIARSLGEQRIVKMNLAATVQDDPLSLCQRRELREFLGQVLANFGARVSPTNYRILHSYWLKGLSLDQIAKEVDLTYEQVRWRHHRLTKKLRAALKPLMYDLE